MTTETLGVIISYRASGCTKCKGVDSLSENTGEGRKIQLDDIAKELGLSKSTVSRAISGKGRIGVETRRKVQEYIKAHDYRPNLIARSLAQSKTYNIGVVLPADTEVSEVPFFQTCLMGICEAAAAVDYDVIVTTVSSTEIPLLKRIVRNKKVDGVVLTRSLVNDFPCEYLKQTGIPFVVIGSTTDDTVVQIDTDHVSACCELVSYILMTGGTKVPLLLGNKSHIVNRSRYKGYLEAFEKRGMAVNDSLVYVNLNSKVQIERAVSELIRKDVSCIVCGDDYICTTVLTKLRENDVSIPDDIKIASFYNSVFLQSHNPPVTAIDINVKELGIAAAQRLIDIIDGREVPAKSLLDYEIVLKKSTM